MKTLLLICFLAVAQLSWSQTFELTDGQSMCMLGKGKGQDATINPYQDLDYSFAIIENIGTKDFNIRIKRGTFSNQKAITRQILIQPSETFKIKLLEGSELYFDALTLDPSMAKIYYSKD